MSEIAKQLMSVPSSLPTSFRVGPTPKAYGDFEDLLKKAEEEKKLKPSDTDFSTGAVRSADANELRFDLIHPIAKIALARVYAEGAEKYGDCNWERGMPLHDLYNHVDRHYTLYMAGDRSEPHLEHAAWGALAMVVSSVMWPELNEGHLRGPRCKLTEAMLKRQEEGDAERKRKRQAGLFDNLSKWTLAGVSAVKQVLGAS